jgi:hypothetical protein
LEKPEPIPPVQDPNHTLLFQNRSHDLREYGVHQEKE